MGNRTCNNCPSLETLLTADSVDSRCIYADRVIAANVLPWDDVPEPPWCPGKEDAE